VEGEVLSMMKPLSEDTPLHIERLWLAGLRARGPLGRLQSLLYLTSFCWQAARIAIQRVQPQLNRREQEAWLFTERYGSTLAPQVLAQQQTQGTDMTTDNEIWDALLPVVDALVFLGVPYYVGGSAASSLMGIARATMDVDLIADLRQQHAEPLTATLSQDYYVDLAMIAEAIAHRRSFNVIRLSTMFKVDVFVPEETPFAHENMARRVAIEVPELGRALYFAAPEDVILHKLRWYAMGSGVSDRQWYDLQGVLRLQAEALDLAYMQQWAERLGLAPLLQRALNEAGL
jgi:hypothetical protein